MPANLSLTPFDEIANPNPFGSSGDLRLMPDPEAGVRIEGLGGRTPLHFYHSDITNLDGTPWEGCVRSMLKAAVADLEAWGCAWFLPLSRSSRSSAPTGPPRRPLGCRRCGGRSVRADADGALVRRAARRNASCRNMAADQFEIVCGPAGAVQAADRAVTIREVTRELAATMGWRASFCPRPTRTAWQRRAYPSVAD